MFDPADMAVLEFARANQMSRAAMDVVSTVFQAQQAGSSNEKSAARATVEQLNDAEQAAREITLQINPRKLTRFIRARQAKGQSGPLRLSLLKRLLGAASSAAMPARAAALVLTVVRFVIRAESSTKPATPRVPLYLAESMPTLCGSSPYFAAAP